MGKKILGENALLPEIDDLEEAFDEVLSDELGCPIVVDNEEADLT